MQVVLKRDAFLGGSLYRRGPKSVFIPDEHKDTLPPDAVIVGKKEPPPSKQPTLTLKDMDEERAATDISKVKK